VALVYHTGFESGDASEITSVTGAVTFSTTGVLGGAYKMVATASAASVYATFPSFTKLLFSFYFQRKDTPSAITSILGNDTSGGLVRINTSNQILFYDATTLRGTISEALTQDTWYRITGGVGSGSATNWLRVYDVATNRLVGEITGVTVAAFNTTLRAGVITSTTATFWFDHFAFNDTFSATQGIEDVRVVAIVSRAAGAVTGFTPSTGANWECVNEIPYSDTDSVYWATASNVADSYLMQSCSTAGLAAGDIIKSVRVMYRMSRATSTSRAVHNSRVRDNATNYDVARTLTTSAVWYFTYYAARPSTGEWTQAAIDAMELGVTHTSTYSQRTNMYACYAQVLYQEAWANTDEENPPLGLLINGAANGLMTGISKAPLKPLMGLKNIAAGARGLLKSVGKFLEALIGVIPKDPLEYTRVPRAHVPQEYTRDLDKPLLGLKNVSLGNRLVTFVVVKTGRTVLLGLKNIAAGNRNLLVSVSKDAKRASAGLKNIALGARNLTISFGKKNPVRMWPLLGMLLIGSNRKLVVIVSKNAKQTLLGIKNIAVGNRNLLVAISKTKAALAGLKNISIGARTLTVAINKQRKTLLGEKPSTIIWSISKAAKSALLGLRLSKTKSISKMVSSRIGIFSDAVTSLVKVLATRLGIKPATNKGKARYTAVLLGLKITRVSGIGRLLKPLLGLLSTRVAVHGITLPTLTPLIGLISKTTRSMAKTSLKPLLGLLSRKARGSVKSLSTLLGLLVGVSSDYLQGATQYIESLLAIMGILPVVQRGIGRTINTAKVGIKANGIVKSLQKRILVAAGELSSRARGVTKLLSVREGIKSVRTLVSGKVLATKVGIKVSSLTRKITKSVPVRLGLFSIRAKKLSRSIVTILVIFSTSFPEQVKNYLQMLAVRIGLFISKKNGIGKYVVAKVGLLSSKGRASARTVQIRAGLLSTRKFGIGKTLKVLEGLSSVLYRLIVRRIVSMLGILSSRSKWPSRLYSTRVGLQSAVHKLPNKVIMTLVGLQSALSRSMIIKRVMSAWLGILARFEASSTGANMVTLMGLIGEATLFDRSLINRRGMYSLLGLKPAIIKGKSLMKKVMVGESVIRGKALSRYKVTHVGIISNIKKSIRIIVFSKFGLSVARIRQSGISLVSRMGVWTSFGTLNNYQRYVVSRVGEFINLSISSVGANFVDFLVSLGESSSFYRKLSMTRSLISNEGIITLSIKRLSRTITGVIGLTSRKVRFISKEVTALIGEFGAFAGGFFLPEEFVVVLSTLLEFSASVSRRVGLHRLERSLLGLLSRSIGRQKYKVYPPRNRRIILWLYSQKRTSFLIRRKTVSFK
jgi:hypothetical protein